MTSSTTADDSSQKERLCARCKNHGVKSVCKSHKSTCKWQECTCPMCVLVIKRQKVESAVRRVKMLHQEECENKVVRVNYDPVSNIYVMRNVSLSPVPSAHVPVLAESQFQEKDASFRTTPHNIGYNRTLVRPTAWRPWVTCQKTSRSKGSKVVRPVFRKVCPAPTSPYLPYSFEPVSVWKYGHRLVSCAPAATASAFKLLRRGCPEM